MDLRIFWVKACDEDFHFLLSSIILRRTYWIREKIRPPVFDEFIHFGRFRTLIGGFSKMPVYGSVCHSVWDKKNFWRSISRINAYILTKLDIQLDLDELNWTWLVSVHIAQQLALLCCPIRNINNNAISGNNVQIFIKL